MKEFTTKMIGIILAFVMMVFAPLTVYSLIKDLSTQRQTMNEVSKFIDNVTDSGKIDAVTLGDFYLACSSHGGVSDVTITRYIKIVNPDKNGGTYVSYTPTLIDNDMVAKGEVDLNPGDNIQVHVKCIDYTGAQRVTSVIFKFVLRPYDITFAGRVRN